MKRFNLGAKCTCDFRFRSVLTGAYTVGHNEITQPAGTHVVFICYSLRLHGD